jgi:hypothetical protein
MILETSAETNIILIFITLFYFLLSFKFNMILRHVLDIISVVDINVLYICDHSCFLFGRSWVLSTLGPNTCYLD